MITTDQLLSFPLSTPLLVAITVAIIAALYILIYFLSITRRVTRQCNQDANAMDDGEVERIDPAAFPSLSVIVYVERNHQDLVEMLPMVLEQDYPAPMEVIVVNDGSRSELEGVLGDLELRYRNLYVTYTPPNSRNLSRKKLSLTIGVKAARYDTLLVTNASVRPSSPLWLRAMTAPLTAGAEIVIGHSILAPAPDSDDCNHLSRAASFDIGMQTIGSLSQAIGSIPYRADGNNLVYRKDVFTANRGFSTHHNFKYGDDDIFINQVARQGRRVAVQLAPEAVVRVISNNLGFSHRFDKIRYMFTGSHIFAPARYMAGMASLCWWCWLTASISALTIGFPSLTVLAAVTAISLSLCIPVMMAYRRTSAALFYRRLTLSVPSLMLWYPLYNMYYRIAGRKVRSNNLTWTAGTYTTNQ